MMIERVQRGPGGDKIETHAQASAMKASIILVMSWSS
jgi:hypothetical protein